MKSNIKQAIISRPYYSLSINYRENDESDLAVIDEMFTKNVYRFDTNKLEQDRPVVLDIGANIGTFTLLALKQAHEMGMAITVYAVEPQQDNLELFKQNIANNMRVFSGGSRLVVVEKGISDFNGSIGITNKSGGSRLNSDSSLQQIDVITFDEFINEEKIDKIDFTKIDIEGSEVPLITGASRENLLKSHFYAIELDEFVKREDFSAIIDPFIDDCSLETWGIPVNGCNIYIENHSWSAK